MDEFWLLLSRDKLDYGALRFTLRFTRAKASDSKNRTFRKLGNKGLLSRAIKLNWEAKDNADVSRYSQK